MNSARNSGRANKRTAKRDPLPDDFGSYEAAAEFWDTHDLTDYEDSEREVANVQINLVRRYQPVKSNLRATSFMNNENPFAQVRLRPCGLRNACMQSRESVACPRKRWLIFGWRKSFSSLWGQRHEPVKSNLRAAIFVNTENTLRKFDFARV